jgi:hypothetical protein
VAVAILLAESTHESIIPARWPALAGGARTGNSILALKPGQASGWPVRNSDRAIASRTAESESGLSEGGGNADALALLYLTLALGGLR